jgi:hypothetical protein
MLAARDYQPDATRISRPILRCRHHRLAYAQTPRILGDNE